MFRHKGKSRTLKHNLRIATLLSFVAGLVNVVGFLSVHRLTTNVTGHFAYLIDEVFQLQLWQGFVYFLFIFFFFLGSFCSNLLVEWLNRNQKKFIFTFPVLIESLILSAVAVLGHYFIPAHSDWVAFALLFAMGMQNSLVTTISNSVVRTTHLTGLFTDLGIEMSQLFFYKEASQRRRLISSIELRLSIISFFFLGGIIGGVFYTHYNLHTLLIASIILLTAVFYDYVKLRVMVLKRNKRTAHHEV
jgi:uncharacterized membrane protein YoaK (UPF0700 family)